MFTVVHGNRLEDLAHRLAALLAEDPPPPLVPEIMVVQSAGMARWLSLRLARTHGVAANVRFPLPAAFLWQTFRTLVPGSPDSSPLDPRVAVWHLRALLDEPRGGHRSSSRCTTISAQPTSGAVTSWPAASPTSSISTWSTGRTGSRVGIGRAAIDWQPALWRRLVARISEPHRVRVQAEAMAALAAGPAPGVLPPRVAVFGIPTMPPAYLAAFRRLAERTPTSSFTV